MILKILHYCRSLFSVRRYPTIRYAFSLLFIFATIAGMAAVISSDSSYVRIVVPNTTIDAGTQFFVEVYAYASAPVNAVDIAIAVPADFVEVLGVDRGESVITLWTEDPHVKDGSVILRGGTYRKGFIGEHKIATINLRAVTEGKAEFLVRDAVLLAGDGKGTPIAVADDSVVTSLYIFPQGQRSENIVAEGAIVILTDINNDGVVTLADISSFMSSWYGKGPLRDFDNDGKMTFRDFSIILAVFFRQ